MHGAWPTCPPGTLRYGSNFTSHTPRCYAISCVLRFNLPASWHAPCVTTTRTYKRKKNTVITLSILIATERQNAGHAQRMWHTSRMSFDLTEFIWSSASYLRLHNVRVASNDVPFTSIFMKIVHINFHENRPFVSRFESTGNTVNFFICTKLHIYTDKLCLLFSTRYDQSQVILSFKIGLLNTMRREYKFIPQQAEVAQGIPGRLRPRMFLTFGTTRVVGRQPYAPAAFTPGEIPGTHFQRLSRPQGTGFCRGYHRKNPQWHHRGIDPGIVRLVVQCLKH